MTTNTPAKQASSRTRTVRFRIKRCDGPGKPQRWETFDVPVEPGANVISCLQAIAERPTTADGKATTPPCYDSSCLEEVCGACTMLVNGRVRQSCTALVDTLAPASDPNAEITLEPMTKFPVLRDLSVDRSRAFHNLKRVKAWVPIDGAYHLGAGPRESIEQQETRYVLSTCMSCACCLEACPQFTQQPDPKSWDSDFLGPHAISQARLFNMHETGKSLAGERLDELAGPGGVSDCGNAQNCVKVCPKEIPLTESIAAVGRAVTVHSIKRFFTGR